MNQQIGIIGFRKDAVLAAKAMGLDVILWSNKPLPKNLPDNIVASHTEPFPEFNENLSQACIDFFNSYPNLACYLALTEASVPATALLEQHYKHQDNLKKLYICHDKYAMKIHAKEANIPVTRFTLCNEIKDIKTTLNEWQLPLYAKPRGSSGSRDIRKIHDMQMFSLVKSADFILEENINGTEFSIEFFIYNKEIIFFNITQYYVPLEINIIPGPSNLVNIASIKHLMGKLVNAFDLNNTIVHMECFKTDLQILLGEFAIRPPGGYLMKAMELAYGFNLWQALIQIKLGQSPNIGIMPSHHTASWVIHPNKKGTITKIDGIEAIRQLKSTHAIYFKQHVNDFIEKRKGTGEDIGHIIFVAKNYHSLIDDVESARQLLKIEIQ